MQHEEGASSVVRWIVLRLSRAVLSVVQRSAARLTADGLEYSLTECSKTKVVVSLSVAEWG